MAETAPSAVFHLGEATIASFHAAIRAQQITCREVVDAYLDRIAAYDQEGPTLNAIMTLNGRARADATQADSEIRRDGITRPLQGVPVLIKDQLETRELATSFGSALFAGWVAGRDAAVVERLHAAGAIILAKNTMSEYAQPGYYGSAFGVSRNPYDLTRGPGGSSCGTGVAIAANLGLIGIGEDTGGSIRNPASSCCLVGLRPTLGLVSRFGMLPGSPTRDTLGPMTRTVADAAVLLDVLAGYDARDPITAYTVGRLPTSYTSFLTSDGLRGKRLGVIREPIGTGINQQADDHRQLRAGLDRALVEMAQAGAEVVDPVDVTQILHLLRQYSGVGETEAAVNGYLATLADPPARTLLDIVLAEDGLVHPGQRIQLAAALGHATTAPAYLTGQLMREALRQEVLKTMADLQLDALVHTTLDHYQPVIPPDILTTRESGLRPVGNSSLSPALGFPALTVPAGFTADGWPVGISFLGRPFTEGLLFTIASGFERQGDHRVPPTCAPPLPGEP